MSGRDLNENQLRANQLVQDVEVLTASLKNPGFQFLVVESGDGTDAPSKAMLRAYADRVGREIRRAETHASTLFVKFETEVTARPLIAELWVAIRAVQAEIFPNLAAYVEVNLRQDAAGYVASYDGAVPLHQIQRTVLPSSQSMALIALRKSLLRLRSWIGAHEYDKPRWDDEEGKLFFAGGVCGKYHGAITVRILREFERQGWPLRISDPLEYGPREKRPDAERLKAAAKALRNSLKKPSPITFRSSVRDGGGLQWLSVTEGESATKITPRTP